MSINTNQLKKFAQNTRKKLLQQVGARLDYILSVDSAEMRDVADIVKRLQQDIDRTSREEVIDQVAYTWFNRLTALRYMDLHDYQPLGLRIISGRDGSGEAEIYQAALRHQLPAELEVDRERISQLITGHITSRNPHNEIMRMLLVAACQNLSKIMPFLFERINGYTELLLPEDLLSDQSILADFRKGMTEENAREVEVIGWLYQFYISEKKNAVFASKGKVSKEEIPAATQLFTPRWIVEYMVQNTVGKLWVINNPNSRLREHMPYYIESELSQEDILAIHSPEELTLLDQACGSGHILVYGFELLHRIYEEAGHAPSEIPGLIIRHNLRGFEIDPRAAQLAALAITLKAREYQRRYFRKSEVPAPHITCFQDLTLSEDEITDTLHVLQVDPTEDLIYDLKLMQQAAQFGSLILPRSSVGELEQLNARCEQVLQSNDLFLINRVERLKYALTTLLQLSQKYACVVDNPPYMGSGKMNKQLSGFVKKTYPDAKADLLACFMERALIQLQENGLLSMINLPSWMFLSSFENFRRTILREYQIESLLHLGRGIFGSDFGTVAFSFRKTKNEKKKGIYRRLFKKHVQVRSIEKIEQLFLSKEFGFYTANQKDFEKIPGSPVGYWLSENMLKIFTSTNGAGNFLHINEGLKTGKNERFIRYWYETEIKKDDTWIYHTKGGEYNKWFGNNLNVLNFYDNGNELRSFPPSSMTAEYNYFKPYVSWSRITSSKPSFRYTPEGFIPNMAGLSAVSKQDENLLLIFLGIGNSKLGQEILKLLNPTLNYPPGTISKMPFLNHRSDYLKTIVKDCITDSKQDWDSRETSWDFRKNELIRIMVDGEMVDSGWSMVDGQLVDSGRLMVDGESLDGESLDSEGVGVGVQPQLQLESIYENYKLYWTGKFYQLHANEEELNRQFIEIYGMQDELTPDVPLDEITILQEELDRKKLKALDKQWTKVGRTMETRPSLPYKDQEVMAQLVSYAVGCMFGRYSLDKEGLILANEGEDLSDYLFKVGKEASEVSFPADEDNVIPIMDEKWFDDDIVSRFREFIRVAFGEDHFRENMNFLTQKLGSDMRRYFVREFYNDHIKRYKKRPIYWMLSSPEGHFRVLIYMHRYTPDTLSIVLNKYLNPLIEMLEIQKVRQQHIAESGGDRERRQAEKEVQRLDKMIQDCKNYRQDTLYPLALKRIAIDLDDGVLVNYNKFGKVVAEVKGLNDKKAKAKVRKFDWIDTSEII